MGAGKSGGTSTEKGAIGLFAPIAVVYLKATMSGAGIVVMIAISIQDSGKQVMIMTHEQFEREINYRVSIIVTQAMLKQGVIDERDYREIDTILSEKYHPILCGKCT